MVSLESNYAIFGAKTRKPVVNSSDKSAPPPKKCDVFTRRLNQSLPCGNSNKNVGVKLANVEFDYKWSVQKAWLPSGRPQQLTGELPAPWVASMSTGYLATWKNVFCWMKRHKVYVDIERVEQVMFWPLRGTKRAWGNLFATLRGTKNGSMRNRKCTLPTEPLSGTVSTLKCYCLMFSTLTGSKQNSRFWPLAVRRSSLTFFHIGVPPPPPPRAREPEAAPSKPHLDISSCCRCLCCCRSFAHSLESAGMFLVQTRRQNQR